MTTTDISSKEFQDAMKRYFDSILAIIECQNDLGKCGVIMNKYAISTLEKLLKTE